MRTFLGILLTTTMTAVVYGSCRQEERNLRYAKDNFANLKSYTEEGTLRSSRLYAKEQSLGQADRSFNQIQENLSQLHSLLINSLSQERKEEIESEYRRKCLKETTEQFNELYEQIKNLGYVSQTGYFDSKYSNSKSLVPEGVKKIELLKFDYTNGFVAECRTSYKYGITPHRNPKTGEITWSKERYSGGAVIGENDDGTPIIVSEYKHGNSSNYNPTTKQWKLTETDFKTPSTSVYNPHLDIVESKTIGYKEGVGGIYDPRTKEIVWKQSYKTGIAGYYDPTQDKLIWIEEYKSGVACVWRDEKGQYFFASSFGSDYGDDAKRRKKMLNN